MSLGGDFDAGTGVVALDVRPATGKLYLLGGGGQLYTVDPSTGEATDVGAPITPMGGIGLRGRGRVRFNPVIDRIRIVVPDDTNLVNPDTGAIQAEQADVAYAPGDDNDGTDPTVTAAAYANSVFSETATATTLFIGGRLHRGRPDPGGGHRRRPRWLLRERAHDRLPGRSHARSARRRQRCLAPWSERLGGPGPSQEEGLGPSQR